MVCVVIIRFAPDWSIFPILH